MFARPLTQRERRILIVTIILFAVCVGNNGILKPFNGRLKTARREVQSKQVELKRQLKLLESIEGIEQAYTGYLEQLQQDTADEQIMSSIIHEVEDFAARNKLRLSDVKPARIVRQNYMKRFPLAIQLEGDMPTIMAFLVDLQQSPLMYKVDRLSLSRKGNRPGFMIRADIVLSKIFISIESDEAYVTY